MSGANTHIPVTPEEALLCLDCLGQGQIWAPEQGGRIQCKRCRGGGYEPARKFQEEHNDEQD